MSELKGSRHIMSTNLKVTLNNGIDLETGEPLYVTRSLQNLNPYVAERDSLKIYDTAIALFSLCSLDVERVQQIDRYSVGGWEY